MAFEYLSGGSTNLANLIFSQILKIDPSSLYKYTTIQDQVIYLILIPHVILFLFIYAFSIGIVGRVTGGHVGFSRLVGVVVYIYMVWAGWYGMLVPIFNAWLMIALGAGLIIFLITAVMHPARGVAMEELAGKIGVSFGKKLGDSIKRDKRIEELYKQKEHIEEQIKTCEDALEKSPNNSGAITSLTTYNDKLKQVKDEIRKLEG